MGSGCAKHNLTELLIDIIMHAVTSSSLMLVVEYEYALILIFTIAVETVNMLQAP